MPSIHATLELVTATLPGTTAPGAKVLFQVKTLAGELVAQADPTIPSPAPAYINQNFSDIAPGDYKVEASVIDAWGRVVGSVKVTTTTVVPDASYTVAGTLSVN